MGGRGQPNGWIVGGGNSNMIGRGGYSSVRMGVLPPNPGEGGEYMSGARKIRREHLQDQSGTHFLVISTFMMAACLTD